MPWVVATSAATVTVAVARWPLPSSVATTVYVPSVAGAVYAPAAVTTPPAAGSTDHVTAVTACPERDAANAWVAPGAIVAWGGLTSSGRAPGSTTPPSPSPLGRVTISPEKHAASSTPKIPRVATIPMRFIGADTTRTGAPATTARRGIARWVSASRSRPAPRAARSTRRSWPGRGRSAASSGRRPG